MTESDERKTADIARLDRVLDQLLAAAQDRPELQEWAMQPLDDDTLDQMQWQAEPWLFPDEILHMARRVGFLPGHHGWRYWSGLDGYPDLPGPVPGQLSWEQTVRHNFQQSAPDPEPTVRWAMIGSDPEGKEDSVVPLLRQPREQAPICIADGIESVVIVSPSLAAFLESFLICLKAFSDPTTNGDGHFPDPDSDFSFSWWAMIHERFFLQPAIEAAVGGPLDRLNAEDQSDHPIWSLRGPEGIMLNDPRLLWPGSWSRGLE